MDARHLSGLGRFTGDLVPRDALHMVVLRSDVAHARITSLDVDAARAMPGVHAVVTADDLASAGIGPLNTRAVIETSDGRPMVSPDRPVLAGTHIRYLGQPVAAIVAETEAEARDAAEAVALDWDPLPVVSDLDAMAAPGAAQIWEDAPDNLSFVWEKGNGAAVEAALAQAAHRVRLRVVHPRIAISPMEPRVALAQPAGPDGPLTLVTPSQGVMTLRRDLAAVLGRDQLELRVRTPDVGGSFGARIWPYPEHVLVLHTAERLGRPVVWQASRSETMLADAPGRGRIDHGEIGLDASGRIVAFRIQAEADMGAYLNAVGAYVVTGGAVRPFGQCYDIPAMHYAVKARFTNAAPTDAYRGAGKPESAATLERLIDLVSRSAGLDPLEVRRASLVTPEQLPYATPMGETYDGGDVPRLAATLEDRADWAGFAGRQAASAQLGWLRGRSAGFHLHATGGSTAERAVVRLTPDGGIEIETGSQDSGQGHDLVLTRIAAEALGIDPVRIRLVEGDSMRLTATGGTGGSSLLPVVARTVRAASHALIETLRERAAAAFEAALSDVHYGAGVLSVAGTDRRLDLAALAAEAGPDDLPACAGGADFEGVHTTFPTGGLAAEVDIDPDTGAWRIDRLTAVADAGRLIHPPGAAGQVTGGIAQGVGEALMEGLVVDAEGQILNASFMDYTLPRADDLAPIPVTFLDTDSPNTPLGAKGIGELSAIGTPGVIMNAVLDALAPLGVTHIDKPMTPHAIWQAIRAAKSG